MRQVAGTLREYPGLARAPALRALAGAAARAAWRLALLPPLRLDTDFSASECPAFGPSPPPAPRPPAQRRRLEASGARILLNSSGRLEKLERSHSLSLDVKKG